MQVTTIVTLPAARPKFPVTCRGKTRQLPTSGEDVATLTQRNAANHLRFGKALKLLSAQTFLRMDGVLGTTDDGTPPTDRCVFPFALRLVARIGEWCGWTGRGDGE